MSIQKNQCHLPSSRTLFTLLTARSPYSSARCFARFTDLPRNFFSWVLKKQRHFFNTTLANSLLWINSLDLKCSIISFHYCFSKQAGNLQFNCRATGLCKFGYHLYLKGNLFTGQKGSFSLEKQSLPFLCRDTKQHLTFSVLTSRHRSQFAGSAFCLRHQTVLHRY